MKSFVRRQRRGGRLKSIIKTVTMSSDVNLQEDYCYTSICKARSAYPLED